MSTHEHPETPPLTRKQLREIRNTGANPVLDTDAMAVITAEAASAASAASDETDAAPVAPPPVEASLAPFSPLARPAEPIVLPEPPGPDLGVDLGVSPLTRRQARQQERIRTASVPVITPDVAAAYEAQSGSIPPADPVPPVFPPLVDTVPGGEADAEADEDPFAALGVDTGAISSDQIPADDSSDEPEADAEQPGAVEPTDAEPVEGEHAGDDAAEAEAVEEPADEEPAEAGAAAEESWDDEHSTDEPVAAESTTDEHAGDDTTTDEASPDEPAAEEAGAEEPEAADPWAPVADTGADTDTDTDTDAEPAADAELSGESSASDTLGESSEDEDETPRVVDPGFGAALLAGGTEGGEPLPPSFDDLISRSSSGSVATPNALILSQSPDGGPIIAPVNATGEVLITGTFNLPEGLGSTGHAPGTADGKEVDAVLIDGELPAHSSPTPIAASAAISTAKAPGEIIKPPAPEKGGRLMLTLAITAGALALALVGVLILAFATGVF